MAALVVHFPLHNYLVDHIGKRKVRSQPRRSSPTPATADRELELTAGLGHAMAHMGLGMKVNGHTGVTHSPFMFHIMHRKRTSSFTPLTLSWFRMS